MSSNVFDAIVENVAQGKIAPKKDPFEGVKFDEYGNPIGWGDDDYCDEHGQDVWSDEIPE